MIKRAVRLSFVSLAVIMLFACAGGKDLEIEIKAVLDGKPADGAKVTVDGVEEGVTDAEGHFSKVIRKKPGEEVTVSVGKEAPGYRIKPWEDSFVMKLPEKGVVDTYPFTVNFEAVKYVTVAVSEQGLPLEGAVVKVKGKKVGTTDEKGEFVYDFESLPKKGLRLTVTKKGYSLWRKTLKLEPGRTVEVSLHKRAVLTVTALTDEYGREKRIPGITVSINGKKAGKTDSKGVYTYSYRGKPGKKVRLKLSAPGYTPEHWESRVVLEGKKTFRRFFYSSKPKPIRVGIYGYVSNTPDEDLTDTLKRIEEAVSNNILGYLSFKNVPGPALREKIRQSGLNIEEMTTKGWQKTKLIRTVDMVILGSVTKDAGGFTIETKVYTSGGKLLLSQINTATRDKDIRKTAKTITKNIIERFPFEGTITAQEDDRYMINLGKADYKIERRMEFAVMSPVPDKSGRVTRYRDIGTLRVNKVRKTASWAETDDLKKGEKIEVGYKVVRRMYVEEERRAATKSFVATVKGGMPPDVSLLGGVNIYIDDMWMGTTASNGTAEIPVRLGKSYDLILYRHGYQRLSRTIRIEKDKEDKEFVLTVNNSLFKVASEPSGANVFIDGTEIGETPILDGKLVNFGFHTLTLKAGGDYRDWTEVVEFNKKVVDRTGSNKIVFFRDNLKIGKRAERSGDIDAAIEAYKNTEKRHPDYSNARHRLAQLYMDEKKDYGSAIREFENVLSLPENKQIIYKQFAVTYTNLGHAYYEMGNGLIRSDRQAAAQNFAEALRNLITAKQNTRFFPTLHYDEALHDTYYYTALSYHKLYLVTKKPSLLDKADLAWREYFDFFPKKLEGNDSFARIRAAAEKYRAQIRDLM